MPDLHQHLHFEYDRDAMVLAVRVTGQFTDDIFKAWYTVIPRYLEGRKLRGALVDFTSVERFDISAAAVHQVSSLFPVVPDPTPRYVIAPQDHVFGMSRMFQIASPKGRDMFYVVRSAREAYDALSLSSPHFERLPPLA